MKISKAKNVTVNLCLRTKKYRIHQKDVKEFVRRVLGYLKVSNADISF
jgi:hypothetical protein